MTLIFEPYVDIHEPYKCMKLCGAITALCHFIKRGLQMNGGKMMVERGLWIKEDKRWIIYHVLPYTLILLFMVINDDFDMSDNYR